MVPFAPLAAVWKQRMHAHFWFALHAFRFFAIADGFITREEARRGLAGLRVPYTSSQLEAFVRGLDQDNDDEITRA